MQKRSGSYEIRAVWAEKRIQMCPKRNVQTKIAALVFLTLKDRVGFQHLLLNPGVLPTDSS